MVSKKLQINNNNTIRREELDIIAVLVHCLMKLELNKVQ